MSRVFAWLVRHLRWLIVAAWIAGAIFAVQRLPTIDQAANGALGAFVPKDAQAIKTELRSNREFGFPLLSRTVVVERDPRGLSAARQKQVVALAARLTTGQLPGFEGIRGAIPVTNALGVPPFSREHSTTALLYLFPDPSLGISEATALAKQLVATQIPRPPGGFVGVTGQVPARVEQSKLIVDNLPWVELGTLLLVALAVGLRFRALGAPAVTLAAVALAYLITSHVVAWVGEKAGFAVPQEVEPLIVVLIFGVVTDYSIFFLSRFRALLAEGVPRGRAAQRTTVGLAPIIFTAGITVVAATASLLVAQLQFFRVFGPGLAFSVLVSLAVAMTFVPAVLGTFGSALYWPRRPRRELPPEAATEDVAAEAPARRPRSRLVHFAARHPVIAMLVVLALLGLAASGLRDLRLSNPVVRGLPADSEARTAYLQGTRGFAPGILSPTVVVASRPGIAHDRAGLTRLQQLLARQRGVALVLGPAQQALRVRLGATLARSGNAARYFVVLDADPLGANAIARLRTIERHMPGLVRRSGLGPGTRVGFAGDTALSAETIDKTNADLRRIAPAALGAIFILLAIFLRALVAPLYLVAASVAGFAAALGIGTYVFQDLLDFEGITYFVPFAVAVLLVSLGSDYNVFLIGRIWQEAQRRPLREAVPIAGSRAARSITLAGLVLAGSFAIVGLVPLRTFWEIALMMAVGLLLDAFLIRTVLVPALVSLVGKRSGWPGRRLARPRSSDPRPLRFGRVRGG